MVQFQNSNNIEKRIIYKNKNLEQQVQAYFNELFIANTEVLHISTIS